MNRVSRFVFLLFFPFHATRPIETTLCRSCAPTAPLKNNDFRIYCVLISSLLPASPSSFHLVAAHKATRVHDRHFARFLSFFLLTLALSRITSPSPLNENESLFARRRFFRPVPSSRLIYSPKDTLKRIIP